MEVMTWSSEATIDVSVEYERLACDEVCQMTKVFRGPLYRLRKHL